MKIKIGLIAASDGKAAFETEKRLQMAVKKCDIKKVDLFAKKLAEFIKENDSLKCSISHWQKFVASIREKRNDYCTKYLLDQAQIKEIMKYEISSEFAEIISLFEKAIKTDSMILELPIEEES